MHREMTSFKTLQVIYATLLQLRVGIQPSEQSANKIKSRL